MPLFHVELIRKTFHQGARMAITADTKEEAVRIANSIAKGCYFGYPPLNADFWKPMAQEVVSAIVADPEGNRHGVPLGEGE